MRDTAVQQVIEGLKEAGVSVVCYLPDSLLKELYPALDQDPDASPRATAEKLDIFQASEAEDIEAFVCDVLESVTDVV